MSLVNKTVSRLVPETPIKITVSAKINKCIDLAYLNRLTKSNPVLMMEMISLYLEQTPPLITALKKSLQEKDWQLLHSTAHKMIPSFSIMGISTKFEEMAKTIQDYATKPLQIEDIKNLVYQLESTCSQACNELKEEFKHIQNKNYESQL
jgi:HPt (histidine-containing phosphotransfer) domain-containing protein